MQDQKTYLDLEVEAKEFCGVVSLKLREERILRE
jgi:hypothetical protein